MATDKKKLVFYADKEIESAYEKIPKAYRSSWVNAMIQKGIESEKNNKNASLSGLKDLHKWLLNQEENDAESFKGELLELLGDFLDS